MVHLMHVTKRTFAVRLLIWLTAMTLPLQGVPASVSCGCARMANAVGPSEPAHGCCCGQAKAQPMSSCCANHVRRVERHSCCGRQADRCTCCPNCRCKKVKHPAPAKPPVERRAAEKSNPVWTLPVFRTVASPSRASYSFPAIAPAPHAVRALDRCASLCRFTL